MLVIPQAILDNMVDHARELAPHECCGILSGKDQVIDECYRITNILATMSEADLSRFEGAKLSDLQRLSPEERADIAFQMDAKEMALTQRDIRSKGLDLLAFYHSHTASPARPSQTDIAIAMEFESYRSKLNLPEPFHLIVSLQNSHLPVIRAFRIQQSHAIEISINPLN
ncbi:MAG: M67 family metallopeptidase [Nitrospira sp.]|nr:M67 family metallopeptidase [Nitrospira sp.]MCB9712035.1 M67 family metallopeptidase [Nitrospiraceae bacterium]HQU28577.1 M67 family metallopeptidase [Nitrospirales bacterium]MCA9464963.1 M67 family metallopeptidase [Nitrospira sp.]MCA9476747.1 M67 family metallopeptidase [Nitrospira sp.]